MPELHVYDFDGTLFRSPPKPAGFSGDWWSAEFSLEPPCIPLKPDKGWWNSQVVAEAKKSIANPDVWAIMATGRLDNPFRWRVPELLKQQGLNFDAVYLSPGGRTEAFKKKLFTRLLTRFPHVTTVHIWEDRLNHLRNFTKLVEDMGRICVPHPVRLPDSEPLCTADEVEQAHRSVGPILYAGAFIKQSDRKVLLNWIEGVSGIPLHRSKVGHHVTFAIKPDDDFVASLPVGQDIRISVQGWAADDRAHAAVAGLPSGLSAQGRVPHITCSLIEGTKPAYSNDLLAKGWTRERGPTLTARVGVYQKGKGVLFSL